MQPVHGQAARAKLHHEFPECVSQQGKAAEETFTPLVLEHRSGWSYRWLIIWDHQRIEQQCYGCAMRHPPSANPQGTINNLISHYGDVLISLTSYFSTWAMQIRVLVQDRRKKNVSLAHHYLFNQTLYISVKCSRLRERDILAFEEFSQTGKW